MTRQKKEYSTKKAEENASKKIALAGKRASVFVFGMFKSDVFFLYAFKLIRFGGHVLALNWAQQIFENKYIDEVHAKQSHDPPPLSHMLYMFLSIDATIQLILVILIVTVYGLYREPLNSFRLDEASIGGVLKDAMLSSLFLLGVGEIIAHFMKKKRYFGYKMQGGATIRAYSEMLFALCIACVILPFGVILRSLGL